MSSTSKITATYTDPQDVVVAVNQLRWPFFSAMFQSFVVCNRKADGKYLLVMRQRVKVNVGDNEVSLNDYIKSGGQLKDIQ